MGIQTAPGIVTNGLVFSYDMNSRRSYKAPPLQNKLTGLSATTGTGTGYVLTSSNEVVNIPGVGDTAVTNCFLQNTGASWCCVNFMNFGNTGNTLSGSTLYTYLLLYRVDSGYTGANYMYRYEYNSSGTYQTEAGVFDNSRRVHLGGGWYYAWGTFTTQPATTNITAYSFSYQYSNFTDKYSWAKVAIVQGDYSGLHPSLWPALNTTVSNTQSLLDLTNNNTITASSLTYGTDGNFSFNGSTNYMTTTNTGITHGANDWTYTMWANWSAITSLGTIYENGSWTSCILLRFENNGFTVYSMGTYWGFLSFTPTLNRWYHLAFVRSGNTVFLYVDGVQTASVSFTATIVPNTNLIFIGMSQHSPGQCFNGRLSAGSIYTRALSVSQIQQNFQALRGRYGI